MNDPGGPPGKGGPATRPVRGRFGAASYTDGSRAAQVDVSCRADGQRGIQFAKSQWKTPRPASEETEAGAGTLAVGGTESVAEAGTLAITSAARCSSP